MTSWLPTLLWTVNGLVLLYFLLINGSYLFTAILAFRELNRHRARMGSVDVHELIAQAGAPPLTLIAPAFNEEATCVESVRSLLTLDYPEHEIIVVNDGSRDGTVQVLVEAFEMERVPRHSTSDIATAAIRGTWRSRWHPNLWLVDKENGGKADALNAGLCFCRTPLFCAMDADSILERDALSRVVRPFLEDRHTVAAGGLIRIANGCDVDSGVVTRVGLPRSLLARFQVLEYLRAFLAGRMGWEALGATMIISGAFGVFRRSTVVEAGGFATDTVGEDLELVIRLHRHCVDRNIPYRITFVPDPVAWTEAPETIRVLGRQRDRWQRGLSEALIRHRGMLFRRRYGPVGMLAFPHFFFLEMIGPAVELMGFAAFFLTILLGWATPTFIIAFLSVAILLGMVLSVLAVGLEEISFRRYPRFQDLIHLFGLAVLENLGYRQLNSWWRIRGMIRFLRKQGGWGEMTRKGFGGRGQVPAA